MSIHVHPWLKRFCSTPCLPEKYFNYFGPWTADVHHPLLKLRVMNVVMTALAAFLGQKPWGRRPRLPVAAPSRCVIRLPQTPDPRSQTLSRPEPKACQFARLAPCLSASVVNLLRVFAPPRLCVESGQPFWPRAPRLSGYIRVHPGTSGQTKKIKKYE